jgi:hypothetical protein
MRLILSILFFSICVLGTAQDTKTAIKSSFQSLSEEEKVEILSYALSLDGNMDKKMKKAIKKLSAEQQELLLRRIHGMEPAIEEPVVLASLELTEATGPFTSMEFKEQEHEFGEITEGDKVIHIFTFKNTGKEPLVISNVRGSCGCTVPEWSRESIAPGKEGEIKVAFNSKGKRGKQTKTVTISANTSPENTILRIKADVNEKTTNK